MLTDEFRQEWTSRLFGGPRFEFGFGMRRGRDDAWFRWDGWDAEALQERSRWLEEHPDWCVVWSPEAESYLHSAVRLFPDRDSKVQLPAKGLERALAFSRHWEPDWLLLVRGADGEFVLKGAVVCFPSSWDVREKMGRGITDVHSIVPGLNASLGDRIRSFLARMPDGAVFERENWGLAATAERNAHPVRGLPRLAAGADLANTWLRLEHQAFRILAGGEALLFSLRIRVIRLDDLLITPKAQTDFARSLQTMPHEVAAYKGLESARGSLINACGSA